HGRSLAGASPGRITSWAIAPPRGRLAVRIMPRAARGSSSSALARKVRVDLRLVLAYHAPHDVVRDRTGGAGGSHAASGVRTPPRRPPRGRGARPGTARQPPRRLPAPPRPERSGPGDGRAAGHPPAL